MRTPEQKEQLDYVLAAYDVDEAIRRAEREARQYVEASLVAGRLPADKPP